MDITNPRRILAISLSDSSQVLSRVIRDLTGANPEPALPFSGGAPDADSESEAPAETAQPSLAGTTHPLALRTPYYTATVPVWLDLVSSPAAAWADSFLSAEAAEVRAALGGVVVVFVLPDAAAPPPGSLHLPASEPAAGSGGGGGGEADLLRAVSRLLRSGSGLGWDWDGAAVAVGVAEAAPGLEMREAWEDICAEAGLEFVLVAPGVEGRNEFGEKMGIPRLLEALEANDWTLAPGLGDEDDDDDDDFGGFKDASAAGPDQTGDDEFDPESLDFGFDKADFEGLRQAIWNAGQEAPDTGGPGPGATTVPAGTVGATESRPDDDKLDGEEVQRLESMMRKLQAVRDRSAGLPEEQRKRAAARAVGQVMKEL